MGDSYRPPPPPPRDRNGGRGEAGFSFRGAADNYRPQAQNRPEERFTFNPPSGPAAPRFPAQQPPPRGPQSNRSGANKRRDRGRGGRQQGGPPFRRVPKPAHAREILQHKERETTPEQMIGMNSGGQPRFVDNASGSEDGESDSSDSDDSSSEDGDVENESSRKRVKTDDGTAAPARPQWSNPDPYSALPPTDLGLQPKKDIVQTIRKAKVDASGEKANTNAIKENADFISFDFGDEQQSEDDDDEDEGEEQVGPPTGAPADIWMPTDQEAIEQLAGPDSRGTKRKYVPEVASRAGTIVTEWKPNQTDPTPWIKSDQKFMASTGLQLHMEIIDFYDFVRPYSHEAEIRRDLIARIEQAVRSFSNAKVLDVEIRSFGSFASDLYLPIADMDLVALSRPFDERGRPEFCVTNTSKHKLSRHLITWGIAKKDSMVVITKAKVPILKFVDAKTDIKVDISFENSSGLRAIHTFQAWRDEFPEMPALVMIIKQFLAMRGLNEVVNGGLGGFTIICLVVSMLQLMPERQRESLDMHSRYGQMLLNFFDLYGNKFNLKETGIRMNPPGYFNKSKPGACRAKMNPRGLTIIDPNNESNDISGGSKQVDQVFSHFRGALYEIQSQLSRLENGDSRGQSILGCILAGNYSSFKEQREILRRIDRARDPPSPRLAPPMRSNNYPPQPPSASYPWQQHPQPAPPPARGGQYYGAHDAYAYQPPGAPLPPRPQFQQPWQQPQGFQSLPPRPPAPGGSGPGFTPINAPEKQSKKSKKKAKQAQQAQSGPSHTNSDKATKPRAKKKKKKGGPKTQEEKEQEDRERNERAKRRQKSR